MAPQSRAPVILLTRPAAQSARFAAELARRFPEIRSVTSPLIEPRFLSPALPARPWTALILTSETAAEAARRITADGLTLPRLAFCVGDHTAEAARAAGFEPVSAGGDAAALVRLILSGNPTGPLLHLRGQDSRGDIEKQLVSAGTETQAIIAYSQESRSLTSEAIAILTGPGPVIAPVFSPRSAEILVAECRRLALGAAPVVIAMSPAVAAAAAPLSAQCLIASRPDADAMLAAIASQLVLLRKP